MSDDNNGHPKVKSPGRVAAARRLNEMGLRGPGGRRPTHAMRMLEGLLKRGDAPEGQLAAILAEHESVYLSDLGGPENVSSMERGIVRRLTEVDLFLALIKARLINASGQPRRLTWSQTQSVAMLHSRLAESYTRMALALGLKRRSREVTDLAQAIQAAQRDGDRDKDGKPDDA